MPGMGPLGHTPFRLCFQAQLSVDVSQCRLLYNGKELERNVPFRFLNVPSAAKLKLVTGSEVTLGVQTSWREAPPTIEPIEKAPSESPSCIKEPAVASGNVPEMNSESIPDVYIFSQEDETRLKQNESSTSYVSEVSYDVTEKDLLLMQSSLSKRAEVTHLKTKKMRKEELNRKLDSMREVIIRLEFGEIIAQFNMSPRATLIDLYDIVRDIIHPEISTDQIVLFTTPPKKILPRNATSSLYENGLVPAAKIKLHIPGMEARDGMELLSAFSREKFGTMPPRGYKEPTTVASKDQHQVEQKTSSASGTILNSKIGERKVPKWFK
jgi:hypothetical protein